MEAGDATCRAKGAGCILSVEQSLQRTIEEKENEPRKLHDKHRSASTPPVRRVNDGSATRSADHLSRTLRIRRKRARGLPDNRATPPLGLAGSPDSVTLPMTNEQRRLDCTSSRHNTTPNEAATHLYSPVKRDALPVNEFESRLNRLLGSAAIRTVHEVMRTDIKTEGNVSGTLAPSSRPTRGSLGVSPVTPTLVSQYPSLTLGQNSMTDLLEKLDMSRSSGGGGDEEDEGRHVRFSSQSPQVATFSVERPGFLDRGGLSPHATILPDVPLTALNAVVECHPRDGYSTGLSTTPATSVPPRCDTSAAQEGATSPFASFASVVRQSARESSENTLSQISRMRGSYQAKDDARIELQVFSAEPKNGSTREERSVKAAPPRTTVLPSSVAKVPLREISVNDNTFESLRKSPICAPVAISAGRAPADSEVRGVPPRGDSPTTTGAWELMKVLPDEGSPIFLRRPDRHRVNKFVEEDEVPLWRDVTIPVLTPPSASLKPRDVVRFCRTSPDLQALSLTVSSTSSKSKKRVRFCEPVKESSKTCAGGGLPKKRSSRERPLGMVPTVIAPFAADAFCVGPPTWHSEEEGLVAGICLPCGPTLYFE